MCACTRWLYMRVWLYVRRRAEAYMAREKETAAADPPSIESTQENAFFFFFPCARARLRLVEWYVQCHLQLEPI
jgi:hypothetical protein